MSEITDKKPKAILNKLYLDKLLDGRSYTWLLSQINQNGGNLSQSTLFHIIHNRSECRLAYSLIMSEIFQVSVESLFKVNK